MYKYHSIEQFRNCIKEVEYAFKDTSLPTLTFTGSVKLHGTNAGVELPANVPQSRNNIISVDSDNMGFAAFHDNRREAFTTLYTCLGISLPIVVYGEWAGNGIQQTVAISNVPKAFYVFGVKVITGVEDWEHYWIRDFSFADLSEHSIYNLHSFKRYEVTVDFNNPKLVQNLLGSYTREVELECPVAKEFGVSGVGEGIVWEHITEDGKLFSFKVKGEKHSSSKVRTLAEADVVKAQSVKEFVDTVLTESRLSQGIYEVFTSTNTDITSEGIGTYIKWVSTDVIKEEKDTLEASGLTIRDVGGLLSKKAKSYLVDLMGYKL